MSRELKAKAAYTRENFPDLRVTEMAEGFVIVAPARITTIDYRCLPDTVDPRGPKGK
jgi:hypothetical protein